MRSQRSFVRTAVAAVLVLASTGLFPGVAAGAAPISGNVTFTGHGFGHGRGMGQYGALGYAVDRGWNHAQILDHFYGGTRLATDAGNAPITVELLSMRGRDTIVTGAGITVDGAAVGQAAVLVQRRGGGTFAVFSGPGCAGPWTDSGAVLGSGLRISSTSTAAPALALCESSGIRAYRGDIQVFEGAGYQATVNLVPVDGYLRGVVPQEALASWGGLPNGLEALKAQAVAARSYALSGGWNSYARTCDTTSCQVYRGAWTHSNGATTFLEHPFTDRAVGETSGQVRRWPDGRFVRTEFSSSSGGWTAGGEFPAVEDLGDATASNPNRNWTTVIAASTLGPRLGTAPVTAMRVIERNGLGADGGRVGWVRVDTTTGSVDLTGDQVRSRLGLKSNWFSVVGFSEAEIRAYVVRLYATMLGRRTDDAEIEAWTAVILAGRPLDQVARDFAESGERIGQMVDLTYIAALGRPADPGGRAGWSSVLARGGTVTDLHTGLYGSPEALARLGGDTGAWVDTAYSGLLGRPASTAERAAWVERVRVVGHAGAAREISASTEARTRRLSALYQVFLGRAPDPGGLAHFLPAMLGRGEFTVAIEMALSDEFWIRAQA